MFVKVVAGDIEQKVLDYFSKFDNTKINFYQFAKDMFANVKGAHLESHTYGVAKISLELAQHNNFSPLEQSLLFWAAFLHDLGKVHIPDEIIMSPHRLNDWQYSVMKMHPSISVRIAQHIPVFSQKFNINGEMVSVCDIVRYHHEKEDGSGYEGVKTLNKFNKILNAADAFEAMRDATRKFNADRSTGIANVLNRMYYDIGTHFDSKYMKSFIRMLKQKGEGKKRPHLSWLKRYFVGREKFFTLWAEGMDYQPEPDMKYINSLFENNEPLVDLKNVMSFIEEFVNRERYLETWIDGDKYRVEIEAEPYIINQEPDLAKIIITKNCEVVAKLEQKKYLKNKEHFMENTGMESELVIDDKTGKEFDKKNDFINGREFISTIAGKFYFNNLNMTEDGFKDTLKKYGAITTDEFRVFVEAQLETSTPDQVKIIMDQLLDDLVKKEIVSVLGHNITIMNDKIANVDIFKKLFDEPERVNYELEKYFQEKYIDNVHVKRDRIFDFWLKVKSEVIDIKEIDSEAFGPGVQCKVLPLIDYVSKINVRCIPVDKVRDAVIGVVDQNQDIDPGKKEMQKHIVYHSLLFNYFIEISGLMDDSFIKMTKDYKDNRNRNYIKTFVMASKYPELSVFLENVMGKYEYQDNMNLVGDIDNVKLLAMVYEFIGSNGHIDYIFNDDVFKNFNSEKKRFVRWLFENQTLVNDLFKKHDVWNQIKESYLV